MSIDQPVDKRQFYSALSTTVVVGVVSVGLSMCPALAIFGIPLAGALGEWSKNNGGDLNPRPVTTAHSLFTRSLSPVDVSTARGPLPSPLPTARSMPREDTAVDHTEGTHTATVKSPLQPNLGTAKCFSPLRTSEDKKWQMQMVREVMKTAVENNEMTARSSLSDDDVSLAVQKALIYQEKDLTTAKEGEGEHTPRVVTRTPNDSGKDDVKSEKKAVTPQMKDIACSPEGESKTNSTTETGQKTPGSLISPSPLITPPMVKVTPQPLMRSSHMTSTSERPRVRRPRKRSRERI